MNKGNHEYRCRRCGRVFKGAAVMNNGLTLVLMNMEHKVESGGVLSAVVIDSCEDGGEGLADLIGFTPLKYED